MAQLPAWVVLSLREASTLESLVPRLGALGVRASVTRDGLVLPGGFLGRIEAPLEARLLDRSIAKAPTEIGPTSLVISGGTNDLAREEHQRPEVLRRAAKDVAATMALVTGREDSGRIESAASRKMTELTKLVVALAPITATVIMPKANNIAVAASELAARAAEYIASTGYHFPLWSYLKLREDESSDTIASTGMWTFGLPDVAMAIAPGDELRPYTDGLGAVKREMVAEGSWLEHGSTLATSLGEVSIDRVRDALFVKHGPETPATLAARSRFARVRGYGLLLGDATHHHRQAGADEIAIEHFLRAGAASMALTNGLSDKAQRGSTAANENDFIELTLTSEKLGPWADSWLKWAAGCIRANDGSRPIMPRDRLALPEPQQGIAGAIVWPAGHLNGAAPNAPTIQLWDLIPFTPAELASFRAEPTAQRAWMDERLARGDIPLVQQRWTAS